MNPETLALLAQIRKEDPWGRLSDPDSATFIVMPLVKDGNRV